MLSPRVLALLLREAPRCCELLVGAGRLQGAAHVGLSNLRWRERDSPSPGDTGTTQPTPSGGAPQQHPCVVPPPRLCVPRPWSVDPGRTSMWVSADVLDRQLSNKMCSLVAYSLLITLTSSYPVRIYFRKPMNPEDSRGGVSGPTRVPQAQGPARRGTGAAQTARGTRGRLLSAESRVHKWADAGAPHREAG